MAKGTIKGSFSGTSASNVYPQIEWSSSSSIANNTSSVTAVLYFVRASSYWKSYNLSGHSVAISINGNSSSANRKFDLRSTSKCEVWRRTVTVAHGSDGKKSITIKASSGSTGISLGSYSVSGTANLDTIPRATQPSVASSSAMGTNVTLNLPRASSSFTHTVKYGNAGHEKTWTGVGASLTYNFPVDEWAQKIQKSTSNGGIWTVTTYNGSQNLGTKSVSMRLTIPDSVVPTTSNFTIADGNAKAQAVLGDGTNFVQRVSVLNVSITASGVSGSWITTSETVIGGKTYTSTANSGRSVSINLNELSGLAGTQAVKVRTKDSRGRWSSYVTQSFNIWAYTSPIISAAIERVDNTTQIEFTKSAKVSSIVIGNVEKNTYTAKTEYRVSNATTWSTAKTETNAFATVTIDGFAIDKSYDIRLTLTDKFTSTSTTTTISTSKVLLDFYRDLGVGIGKLYEPGDGVLDIGGDVTVNAGLLSVNGSSQSAQVSAEDLVTYNRKDTLTNTVNFKDGSIRYTRQGSQVNAGFSFTLLSDAGWVALASIPKGYTPASLISVGTTCPSLSYQGHFCTVYPNESGWRLIPNSGQGSGGFQGSVSYTTYDDYPLADAQGGGHNYVYNTANGFSASGDGSSNQCPAGISNITFNPEILGNMATIQFNVVISNYVSGSFVRLKMNDAVGVWSSFGEFNNISGNTTKLVQWKGTLLPLKDGGKAEIDFNTDLKADIKITQLRINKGSSYQGWAPA